MRKLIGALSATTGLALVMFAGMPVHANEGDDVSDLAGLEYVALGDSYQAGFGLIPYSSTSPFAGDPNGCYQGDHNYPNDVAAALGLTIDDQTCSGAITANIGYGSATVPATPSNVILPTLPTASEQQTTMSGLLAPQVQSAALSASTDVVTVGIGGNDLGFSSIATACMRLTLDSDPAYLEYEVAAFANCQDYFDDPTAYPSAYLKDRLSAVVQPRLDATFAQIRAAAPNAQVFVVGYPQIAPADATDSCYTDPATTDAVPFNGNDIRFIHEIEALLDDVIETEAAAHEFHFVPTWSQTAAHTLCAPEPWIWGLTAYVNLVDPSCDSGYIPGDADAWVCLKLGALHPDDGGVAEIETLVQSALSSAMGVEVVEAAAPPGGQVTVVGGGFGPGEDVDLRWGDAAAGTATADGLGAFSAVITLPVDTAAGDHAVVATGQTSGRSFSTVGAVAPAPTPEPTDPAPTPEPTDPAPTPEPTDPTASPETTSPPAAPASTDPDPRSELAASGVDPTAATAAGAALLALGAALAFAGRRARRA